MEHNWAVSTKERENLEKCFLKCWEKWYFLENIMTIMDKEFLQMEDGTLYNVVWLDKAENLKKYVGLSFRKSDKTAIVIVKNWSK